MPESPMGEWGWIPAVEECYIPCIYWEMLESGEPWNRKYGMLEPLIQGARKVSSRAHWKAAVGKGRGTSLPKTHCQVQQFKVKLLT